MADAVHWAGYCFWKWGEREGDWVAGDLPRVVVGIGMM